MSEVTLEDALGWLGPISRCDIACGSYGDKQWEVWKDDGNYVEAYEHDNYIRVYKNEVDRLRKIIAEHQCNHYRAVNGNY